jgi:hypothetical protein
LIDINKPKGLVHLDENYDIVAYIKLFQIRSAHKDATMNEQQKPAAHVEIAVFVSLVALVVIITLLASNVNLPV